MQKTQNFSLNKPEAADPMRVSDFNENSDIIDAALKQVDDNSVTRSAQVRSEAANALAAYQTANDAAVAAVNTAVSTKAEQSAVDALTTAVGQIVVPKITVGIYAGTGSTDTPTTVEVGFAPKMVLVWGNRSGSYSVYNAHYCGMAVHGQTLDGLLTLTDTGFQVAARQNLNYDDLYPNLNADRTYFYLAIG